MIDARTLGIIADLTRSKDPMCLWAADYIAELAAVISNQEQQIDELRSALDQAIAAGRKAAEE